MSFNFRLELLIAILLLTIFCHSLFLLCFGSTSFYLKHVQSPIFPPYFFFYRPLANPQWVHRHSSAKIACTSKGVSSLDMALMLLVGARFIVFKTVRNKHLVSTITGSSVFPPQLQTNQWCITNECKALH